MKGTRYTAHDHHLAHRSSLTAEELAGEPMIVRRHCEILAVTRRFFTARGIRPFCSARTTDDDHALGYVRAGLGVTIMPEGFRDPAVAQPHLAGLDLTGEIGLLFVPHLDAATMEASPTVAILTGALDEARAA